MTSSDRKKVIVIGGGVAGLSAASQLVKWGLFDVRLFEADRRIGGRVQSVEFGDYKVENGAQWVHGEVGNSIFQLVEKFDVLDPLANSIKFSYDSFFVTQSGEILANESHLKTVTLISQVLEGPHPNNPVEISSNDCVGDWATNLFEEVNSKDNIHPKKEVCEGVLDWLHRFQNNIDGADNWFHTSCVGQDVYESCEGNSTIPWKPPVCYSSLLNIILNDTLDSSHHLPIELPSWIHLEKEVSEVNYSTLGNGNAEVVCNDGTKHSANHVICTVSLGVLKSKHNTLFKPNLSETKQKAIKHLGFGSVDKLHFEFEKNWWPEGIVGFNLVWEDYESTKIYWNSEVDDDTLQKSVNGLPIWTRCLLGFYPVKSHPKCLMTWLTGPAARLTEKLDDEFIKNVCLSVLKQFLGKTYEIGDPKGFIRSSWHTNPYTRGSYSFRTVESEKENVWAAHLALPVLSETESPTICFAGEATHDHFYSTVHDLYMKTKILAELCVACGIFGNTKQLHLSMYEKSHPNNVCSPRCQKRALDTGKREASRIADFYGCCIE